MADMEVDILRYEGKKVSGTCVLIDHPPMAKQRGFYIVPFMFNSRLLVAISQLMKVTHPALVA